MLPIIENNIHSLRRDQHQNFINNVIASETGKMSYNPPSFSEKSENRPKMKHYLYNFVYTTTFCHTTDNQRYTDFY